MHYGRCASGKLVLFSQIVLMLLLIFVKRQSTKEIDSNNSFRCDLMYYTLKNFLNGIFFFFRHLTSLKHEYGQQLLINLLGSKEGENTLSVAYQVSCLFRNYHPFHCKIQILKFGKRNSSLMSRFNTFCFCLLPQVAVTSCNFQFLLRGGGRGVSTQAN